MTRLAGMLAAVAALLLAPAAHAGQTATIEPSPYVKMISPTPGQVIEGPKVHIKYEAAVPDCMNHPDSEGQSAYKFDKTPNGRWTDGLLSLGFSKGYAVKETTYDVEAAGSGYGDYVVKGYQLCEQADGYPEDHYSAPVSFKVVKNGSKKGGTGGKGSGTSKPPKPPPGPKPTDCQMLENISALDHPKLRAGLLPDTLVTPNDTQLDRLHAAVVGIDPSSAEGADLKAEILAMAEGVKSHRHLFDALEAESLSRARRDARHLVDDEQFAANVDPEVMLPEDDLEAMRSHVRGTDEVYLKYLAGLQSKLEAAFKSCVKQSDAANRLASGWDAFDGFTKKSKSQWRGDYSFDVRDAEMIGSVGGVCTAVSAKGILKKLAEKELKEAALDAATELAKMQMNKSAKKNLGVEVPTDVCEGLFAANAWAKLEDANSHYRAALDPPDPNFKKVQGAPKVKPITITTKSKGLTKAAAALSRAMTTAWHRVALTHALITARERSLGAGLAGDLKRANAQDRAARARAKELASALRKGASQWKEAIKQLRAAGIAFKLADRGQVVGLRNVALYDYALDESPTLIERELAARLQSVDPARAVGARFPDVLYTKAAASSDKKLAAELTKFAKRK